MRASTARGGRLDATIMIVGGSVRRGGCRYCGARVLWATVASARGRRARDLPFNLPRPFPLSVIPPGDLGVAFEVWPRASVHLCRLARERRA